MRIIKILFWVIFVIIPICSCAPSKVITKSTDVKKEVLKAKKYIVKGGDSLWEISARDDIFGDPFKWPLVYKSNRDQIESPDRIEIDQEFNIDEKLSDSDIKKAIQKAKNTPPYR